MAKPSSGATVSPLCRKRPWHLVSAVPRWPPHRCQLTGFLLCARRDDAHPLGGAAFWLKGSFRVLGRVLLWSATAESDV